MPKIPNFILALISALLLSVSWFYPFTIFIFFALVPLFIIEQNITNSLSIKRKKLAVIGYSYLVFFTWNICVTWWIYFASFGGAALAIICNSLLMTIVFNIWRNFKERTQYSWAIWALIPIWLAFEYGHTLWDLTWTWLTLGNVFAFSHNWVQWYEFTGTSGGSLWVLIVNILLFKIIKSNNYSLKTLSKPIAIVLIPIIISIIILKTIDKPDNKLKTYKTLIIQPNIDPYNEKFYFEPEVQLKKVLTQINSKLDSTIDYLVLPETFLTETIYEGQENNSFSINFLRDSLIKKYPNLTIITGANTIYSFKPNEEISATAQQFNNSVEYYDSYNTGMQINNSLDIAIYHKSKLVPGVEQMPFPALLKPLEKLAINLGGTIGSLGTQKERTVFFNKQKTVGIAPVICYESVYPDFVAEYVRNGANLIFIMTNDGWWENTPGHKQHLAYAQLRAIETRREIARCANTGISCFITKTGEIEQATKYWEKATITKSLIANNENTFFVKFGDLISYTGSILALLLITIGWYYKLFLRKKEKIN